MAGRPPSSAPPPVGSGALAALLRPELTELRAYGGHQRPGARVRLDANEAPPSASPAVRDAVARAVAGVALERYPDPRALRLKEAIARRTGARPDELLVGSGSDELIALALAALSRPREGSSRPVVLTPTPTFVMYRVSARGHGHEIVEVPLDEAWDLDVSAMAAAIDARRPNVVFIASPNNPTGNRMSEDRLRAVVAAASGAFTVLDEAYIDYAPRGASVRGWRERHGHLGILRTLSKVGLAALRVGWLEADSGLIAEIDKVRQPFNLSATSQAAAAAVLEDAWEEVERDVARVVAQRDELARAIAAIDGCAVTPSDANFLWVETASAASAIHEAMAVDGVVVRSFHAAGGRLSSRLRITVGTDAENEALLASLRRATQRARGGAETR